MDPERGAAQGVQTRTVTLRVITLPEAIAVGDLAKRIAVDPVQLIKQLMRAGVFASMNQVVDFDTAALVVRTFGYAARKADETGSGAGILREEDSTHLESRPPVVTILGHVDHGKTTLLDAVRRTKVVEEEAGGITQHIGAYQVDYKGNSVTFLDTPGHEAFTAMRARGARVTDVAVLVVAADDGVMPQTAEAIDHIKAAGVPIVVALNKMDLPDADPDRVKRQLSEQDLVVEEWGGDVITVPVSARQRHGIDDLLESILVVAEVSDLRANPLRQAVGVVVEARMDKSRGPLATALVQTGTLRVGDNLVVGTTRGRVKALLNDQGKRVRSAGPSTPVEVLGLSELPEAGDRLTVVADERTARELVADRQRAAQVKGHHITLADINARAAQGEVKEMGLVLKTDVQGTVDAVRTALEQLSTNRSRVRIIHAATGSITESDVMLAEASEAVIVGFSVRAEPGAARLADQDGVEIRHYDIIYRLTEDIERALTGLLEPAARDVSDGILEVRAVFHLSRNRTSAGCYVQQGRIARGSRVRVFREDELLSDGPIASLRRFKDDVREVTSGYECGLTLEGFSDFAVGDRLVAYRQQ